MARSGSAPGAPGQENQRQRVYTPRQPAGGADAQDPPPPPPKPIWWDPFFAALAQTGNQTLAARAAKIDRSTPRKYLLQHPELREDFDATVLDSLEAAVDNLEAVARQRSTIGWEEPVIHQGRQAWQICPGSGLPGNADSTAMPCPYCKVSFNPTKAGLAPEHPLLDDKGQPKPLTVKKFDNTLLMFLHNVSHRGQAAKRAGRDDGKGVDATEIAKQVRQALEDIETVMDPQPPEAAD
jgi:hypothetical protein